jgi:5-formyltetrahydrofolate cyclo-ligase
MSRLRCLHASHLKYELLEKCRVSDFSASSAGPGVDLVAAKNTLRSALLKARRERSAHELTMASLRVLVALSDLVRTTQPTVIATYIPFGTEPGAHLPRPLPEILAQDSAVVSAGVEMRVLVPELLPDNDLDWRDWQDADGRLGVGAISRADLVIVPALAVDERGVRLGRGGGSYDRALARVRPGVPVVALLYDGEVAHMLPAQPHDRRVSAVITPTTGMVRLPRGVEDGEGRVPLLALDE